MRKQGVALLVMTALGTAGCSTLGRMLEAPLQWVGLSSASSPAGQIDAADLERHIKILSSDEFAGRLPGGIGETRTLEYLERQFRNLGLAPGNPDGGYRQAVALVGLRAQADAGIEVAGRAFPLRQKDDLVTSTDRVEALVRVRKSPLVFVGYGIQAPEYDWDDYKGLDMRGKTLLMLVNDPPIADPARAGQLDPGRFKGEAMTYYGRWTYKFEMAAKLGAAAVLVIHETEAAGYPWAVIAREVGQEHFTLDKANGNSDRVPVQGWIRDARVAELFAVSGLDFNHLKAAAAKPDFRPVELPGRASFQVRNVIRKLRSSNVVARVKGTQRPDELLIYTAHWDHLGSNPELAGDQIYNGALDNASGVAGLLELAEVFAAAPPARSVLFLALTAEEQGLLGARHYAENPLYSLHDTLAVINMDVLNPWGRTRDVEVTGLGQSTLEDQLERAAAAQNRSLRAEAQPQNGYYFRSDHFEFARQGVPALFAHGGGEFVGRSPGYGLAQKHAYIAQDYHQVSDEFKSDWDLSGAVEDLQLFEAVGRQVAADSQRPSWKPGSEFGQIRQQRHP